MVVTGSAQRAEANGTTTVFVQGEIDIATAPNLRQALAEAIAARPSRLVVDLSATTFLDCSGARAIIDTHHHIIGGCQIILRAPAPMVRKVIELIGLHQICLIEP